MKLAQGTFFQDDVHYYIAFKYLHLLFIYAYSVKRTTEKIGLYFNLSFSFFFFKFYFIFKLYNIVLVLPYIEFIFLDIGYIEKEKSSGPRTMAIIQSSSEIVSITEVPDPGLGCWRQVGFIPNGSAGKESACNAGDAGSIPGLRRSPGEGNGNPLQCSCLENLTDRGAWQATVHEVAKSQTQLK